MKITDPIKLTSKELKMRERKFKSLKKKELAKKYALKLDEYQGMMVQQEGRCKICNQYPQTKNLCVDHDHTTGKVRSLLCHRCNLFIGLVHEDISTLRSMIKYLVEWKVFHNK